MNIPIPKLPFYPPLPEKAGPMPAPHPKQQELDRVFYPECDGNPIAESTQQFEWIELVKGGLEILFADEDNVFVAADLLWYPEEGQPGLRTAPDALVALGRPKGHRGSYLQWREDNLPPQVVFEIVSPGNTVAGIEEKRQFYDRHGVLEYYIYDPVTLEMQGHVRTVRQTAFTTIGNLDGWVTPLLHIRFGREANGEMRILHPNGRPFVGFVELSRQRDSAERALQRAEEREEAAQQRAEQLAARLRELGIDPDAG